MERALVERARRGDPEAFEMIVEARVDEVFRVAMAVLGSEADALDATQETFVAAWRGMAKLRDPALFDRWLHRIGLNSARMVARRRRALRELPMGSAAEMPSAAGARPDVLGAFDRLAVEQRWLLTQHHLEGRSVAELGAVLHVPQGTVKSRLHTARAALRRALDSAR